MIELILLAFVAVASVGPTNLMAIKEGIKQNGWVTFWIVLGGVFVDIFYASLAALGLSKLSGNWFFQVILLSIAVILLSRIGYGGIRSALKKEDRPAAKKKYSFHPLLLGLAMTFPYPLVILFWTSALASSDKNFPFWMIACIILSVGSIWAGVEGIAVQFFKRFITPRTLRVIEFLTSIIILGFGLKAFYQLVQIL